MKLSVASARAETRNHEDEDEDQRATLIARAVDPLHHGSLLLAVVVTSVPL
jgi:hypothetical protein